MNKFILILAIFSFNALAAEKPVNNKQSSPCEKLEKYARSIIKGRMMGISAKRLIGTANNNSILKEIVIDAFNVPKFSSEPFITNQINEFSNRWYLKCVRIQSK